MTDKVARGFVAATAELPPLSKAAACTLLQSPHPQERTLAARWMAEHLDADLLDALIQQLSVEAKLYAKLEICQTLASGGSAATRKLLPYLGTIGHNQYHDLTTAQTSRKKSFPLPRDIVARTLGRTSVECLVPLLDYGELASNAAFAEWLDAIGYFCFEHPSVADVQTFQRIYAAYSRHEDSELIQWKFVTVCSLFAKELTQAILGTLEEITDHPVILQEIQRTRTLAK